MDPADDEGQDHEPAAAPPHPRGKDALPATLTDGEIPTMPVGWQMTDVLAAMCHDPTARRRGVRLIRLHLDDWRRLGEPIWLTIPASLGCFDHTYAVPVQPTGRKKNWVRWLWRREKDGKPLRPMRTAPKLDVIR